MVIPFFNNNTHADMAGNSYVFRSGVFNKTDKSAEV